MEILWKSYGSPLEVLWKSYGNPMEVHWKSNGNPMEIRWKILRRYFGSSSSACAEPKMPQVRLEALWGLPPKADRDGEVRDGEVKVSRNTRQEQVAKKVAEEVGVEFVPNGSCDRYGNLRRNVGGRPKKEINMKFSPSNRRSPGKKKRMEFGAIEKIEMLTKVQSIERTMEERLSCQSKEIQEMEARKMIRKEMPALWCKKKIDLLKQQGPELKRIIFERRLNKSLGRSRPAQLDYWYVSSGIGCRKKGGG